jgi:hypothetical protein
VHGPLGQQAQRRGANIAPPGAGTAATAAIARPPAARELIASVNAGVSWIASVVHEFLSIETSIED